MTMRPAGMRRPQAKGAVKLRFKVVGRLGQSRRAANNTAKARARQRQRRTKKEGYGFAHDLQILHLFTLIRG